MSKFTPEAYAESASKYGITPGPWWWRPGGGADVGSIAGRGGIQICDFGNGERYYPTEGISPEGEDLECILSVPNLLIERDALKAENERLRKALHRIAYEPLFEAEASDRKLLDGVTEIARAALTGGAA